LHQQYLENFILGDLT